MRNSGPKLAVFEQFAEVAKALGHSCRLAILEHLAQGERSVDVLAQRRDCPWPTPRNT